MESLGEILSRFMHLLTSLPGPYDRPTPAARKHTFSQAAAERARMPHPPLGHHARPYLRWIEMNPSGPHRREPFC